MTSGTLRRSRRVPSRALESMGPALEPLERRALLAVAVAEYYPLNIGDQSSFSGEYLGGSATAQLTVAAGGIQGGVSTRKITLAISGFFTSFTDSRYFSTAAGLRLMRREQNDDGLMGNEVYSPGVVMAAGSVNIGGFTAYSGSGTGSIPSEGITFSSALSGRIDYFPEETVSTPAGVFRAIKVVRTGMDRITAPGVNFLVNESETLWLVHNLGIVRIEHREYGVDTGGESYDDRYSFSLTSSKVLDARRGFWLTGKTLTIAQADDTPTTADGTNYGGIDVSGGVGTAGATKTRVFVIHNNGLSTLTVQPIEIAGANASEFTLVRLPATSIPSAGSTPFSVRFDPTAAGFRFATITIRTSDPLADPFTFTIRGTGLLFGAITVRRSDKAQAIVAGSTAATLAAGTSLGRTTAAGAVFIDRTFVIANVGLGTLNLSGTPRVLITGAAASDYQVLSLPPASIASGGSATFVLRFDPSAIGARSAVVQIMSSDRLLALFTFAIVGTGL